MQIAPPAFFGTLIPILSTKVGNYVQEVAQRVADLKEVELLRQKKGIRPEEKGKEGKKGENLIVKVSRKVL